MDIISVFETEVVGSTPAGPANALMDKLVKSALSKGAVFSVRIGVRAPILRMQTAI